MSTNEIAEILNEVLEMSSKGLKSLVKGAEKGFKKIAESPFKD